MHKIILTDDFNSVIEEDCQNQLIPLRSPPDGSEQFLLAYPDSDWITSIEKDQGRSIAIIAKSLIREEYAEDFDQIGFRIIARSGFVSNLFLLQRRVAGKWWQRDVGKRMDGKEAKDLVASLRDGVDIFG